MKRLAAIVVASGVACGAWGQGTRVWTNPAVPARDALDRLNLQIGWGAAVPVAGKKDGIATVQHFGGQVVVQTFSGTVEALDAANGAVLWITRIGEPYLPAYPLAASDTAFLIA